MEIGGTYKVQYSEKMSKNLKLYRSTTPTNHKVVYRCKNKQAKQRKNGTLTSSEFATFN